MAGVGGRGGEGGGRRDDAASPLPTRPACVCPQGWRGEETVIHRDTCVRLASGLGCQRGGGSGVGVGAWVVCGGF